MKVRKNTVITNNSWLGFSGSNEYTYYSLEKHQTYFMIPSANRMSWFASFVLLEDENHATQSRKVETIWDALADAGGFNEVISLIAFFILFNYQNYNYFKELSKVLYFSEAKDIPIEKI